MPGTQGLEALGLQVWGKGRAKHCRPWALTCTPTNNQRKTA
jgi:hypothetical protein